MRIGRNILITLLLLVSGFILTSCGKVQEAEKQVYITQIANPEVMLTKFKNREVDGFLMWEPYPHEAMLGKYGVILKKSSEIWPNHPDCVVAVSNKQIDQDFLTAFMWAHLKATRFINNPENNEKVIRYAMEFANKNKEIISASLTNIKFEEYPDELEFRSYYNELKKSVVLTRRVEDIGYKSDEEFFKQFLDRKTYEEIRDKMDRNPEWRPKSYTKDKAVKFGRIVPGIFHLASYVAEKEGYYQMVGLAPGKNLIIEDYFHGIAIMQKFKTNELDIAYVGVAPATLKRINDGTDIRIVAGVEGQDSALVVRNDQGIKDVKDLAGKTIVVPAVGNVQYVILEKAVREAGLKPVVK